jgi:hypothetical protein
MPAPPSIRKKEMKEKIKEAVVDAVGCLFGDMTC